MPYILLTDTRNTSTWVYVVTFYGIQSNILRTFPGLPGIPGQCGHPDYTTKPSGRLKSILLNDICF